jgi:serine/threonine-protein kinase
MNNDPRVSDLLLMWEEGFEQGQPPAVEELCRDCPHLLDELRRQVHALQALSPFVQKPVEPAPVQETWWPGKTPEAASNEGEHSLHWPAIPGYEIEREIGRGGMGVVYLARQCRLNRLVALKMLLPEACGNEQQWRRFQTEAEIIARLHHPHIVQVYEVGEIDGRAFCSLELIDGGNLAEALDGQPCPPRVAAELLATLAEAVQAAHEKGVLHRDLKPANVLLSFSRDAESSERSAPAYTQGRRDANVPANALRSEDSASRLNGVVAKLTDFGLAKQLTTDQGLTESGMVMGTPSYIAPEQVQGRVRELGPPADVYSLGAIFYEILTGRPPLLGPTVLETLQLVLSHDPLPPRSLQPRIPRDLETICLKCLHKDPGRRYGTARELSKDLRRFLSGEPVRARRAPVWERAARWVRRRPATAAVIAFLVLAAAGGTYLVRQHELDRLEAARRQAELGDAVVSALDKVADLRQQARWGEARAVLEQVRQQLGPAGAEDLRRQVAQAEAELVLVDQLDAARLKGSVWMGSGFDNASAVREYTAAFRDAGLGDETEAAEIVAQRIRESAVREQLVAALDDWAMWLGNQEPARREWLLAVARLADPDSWRNRSRAAEVWRNRRALERLAREANVSELSPQTVFALAGQLRGCGADSVPLLKAAQRRYPGDFWLNMELGSVLVASKRDEEGLGYLRAAVALRPRAGAAHTNLGLALAQAGRVDEGIAEYKKALEIDDRNVYARTNLGGALYQKGRVDEAIAEARKAMEIDPMVFQAPANLAMALYDKGLLDEAIAECRKALKLEPRHASSHSILGRSLQDKGDLNGAIVAFRKLVEIEPGDVSAHCSLAHSLYQKGRLNEAIAEYKKTLELDPKLSAVHDAIGIALRDKGRLDEAIAEHEKALEIDPKNVDAHNSLGVTFCDFQRDYGRAEACFRKALELDPKNAQIYMNLGNALRHQGRVDEAIAEYHKAIKLDPKLDLVHDRLGYALFEKGRLEESIAEYKEAIKLNPKFAAGHYNLGAVLEAQGKLDEAIAEYKKAVELDFRQSYQGLGKVLLARGRLDEASAAIKKAIEVAPNDVMAHTTLAAVLGSQGKWDEVIAVCKKVINLDPKYFGSYYNLGKVLSERGKWEEAIVAYEKAIELNPSFAEAHCNLGNVYSQLGRFSEAAASIKRGHKLGSRQPSWSYPSAPWLRDAERMAVLASKLPALVRGDYRPRDNAERLELVRVCLRTRHHAAAARLYAEIFADEPKQSDDLKAGHRYNAACAAALAGGGRGEDARQLDDRERGCWRRQALTWLRADLALRARQAERGKPEDRAVVRKSLQHWQADADLAGIRDKEALAKLPADERAACQKLWDDVTALLRKM